MKFMPLFKNKMWGGNKIKQLGFDYGPLPNCGELWALSAVEGNESVVSNGFLADNTLDEGLEIYMGELVGEQNYLHFGNQFPLLIKLIDSNDRLSIQVHPSDELAAQRGLGNGKTEMWYIIDAEEDAEIIDGFCKQLDQDEYQQLLDMGRLEDFLHTERPQTGDVFFIPAGRVHSIGKGILLAEIQQTSDTTYRIYDYNRTDTNGQPRQLHTAEALDAIDFGVTTDARTHYTYRKNSTVQLVECPCFTTSLIALDQPMHKDFSTLDSFVVYMCVDGIAAIKAMDTICPIHTGECVLVPAVANSVELYCTDSAKLLEVYIDPKKLPESTVDHTHDFDWTARFVGSLNTNDNEGSTL